MCIFKRTFKHVWQSAIVLFFGCLMFNSFTTFWWQHKQYIHCCTLLFLFLICYVKVKRNTDIIHQCTCHIPPNCRTSLFLELWKILHWKLCLKCFLYLITDEGHRDHGHNISFLTDFWKISMFFRLRPWGSWPHNLILLLISGQILCLYKILF